MTGIVQGVGEGGATLGGGVGDGGGGHVGGGRHRNAVPPCILIALWQFFWRGHKSYIGNDGLQTNDNQKLTKGGF
jgi:hypothetical protein